VADHHLLIETKIENKVAELNDYLHSNEIATNSSFELIYKIKNIGDKKFPGGKIAKIAVILFPERVTYSWSFDPPLEIPEIVEGTSVTQSQTLESSPSGIFSFAFEILPNKKGEILYYKDPSEQGSSDRYKSSLYTAVDRRQVEIAALLHQILNNLKKE